MDVLTTKATTVRRGFFIDTGLNYYILQPVCTNGAAMLTQKKPRSGYVKFEGGFFETDMGRLRLTPKQSTIIFELMLAKGSTVSSTKLLEAIGYHKDARTHTLQTHIYRLRQLLGNIEEHNLLLTLKGGYALNLLQPHPAIQ